MAELQVEDIRDLVDPLVVFWSLREAASEVERLEAEEIPEPYRGLLAHDRDMTPTLEAFWGSEIRLDIQVRVETASRLLRHVILRTADGKAAAFGAIRIPLAPYSEEARRDILTGVAPLGTLLQRHGIEHVSSPAGFFRMAPNAMTRQAFGAGDAAVHYGRHNRLSGRAGLLAEVVEILPVVGGPPARQP